MPARLHLLVLPLGLALVGVLIALLVATPAAPVDAAYPQAGSDVPGGGPSPTPASCSATWHIVASPNSDPGENNWLNGVAAAAPNDVWAFGQRSPYPWTPLIQHWDGVAWSSVPGNFPAGIAINGGAAQPGEVWAVGGQTNCCSPEAVALYNNGGGWTPLPSSGVPSAMYNGAAAIGPGDAWVVGQDCAAASQPCTTLTVRVGASAVRRVASPNLPGAHNYLNAVAVASVNDAWAVGYIGLGTGYTLIQHWDGFTWSTVPHPTIINWAILTGVAVVDANDVWAVGSYVNTGGHQTLTYRWDGSFWNVVPSPNTPTGGRLRAAAAAGPNNVWAVGDDNAGHALVLHWNGTAWSIVPVPSVGQEVMLKGVVATGPQDVWAVGSYLNSANVWRTLILRYAPLCGTPTPSPTVPASPTATITETPSATPTPQPATPVPTATPPRTSTAPPAATPTACALNFIDVPPTNPFYLFIRCLACRQIVSGYADGTFRWANDVTRGQLAKILASAAGLSNAIPSTQQTFADAPAASPFWLWIERLAGIGAISGYACGGMGEPCDPSNRPYFRPGAPATRGQIAKITALTADIRDPIATTQQTFADVPGTNPFWLWIEQLAGRQIISGYTCGGSGEPCDPANRPYFRWGAATTRGQMAKIAANTFFPACVTP